LNLLLIIKVPGHPAGISAENFSYHDENHMKRFISEPLLTGWFIFYRRIDENA
jgi:hypothetical protein